MLSGTFLNRVIRIILAFLLLFPTALPALRVKATSAIPPAAVRVEKPVGKPQLPPAVSQLKTPRAQEDVPVIEEPDQTYNYPTASYSTIPSPDGKSALICGEGTVYPLIDLATGQVKQVFNGDHGGTSSVAFSPDGSKLLLNNSLYDVASGAKTQTFVIEGGSGDPQAGDISPDGAKALVMQDKKAFYFDIAANTLLETYDYSSNNNITRLGFAYFSPDGSQFVTGGYRSAGDNNAVWVNSVITTTPVFYMAEPDVYDVHNARFSPDGKSILVAESSDYQSSGRLRRFNIATGAEEYNYANVDIHNMHTIDVMTTTTQTLIVAGGQRSRYTPAVSVVDYDTGALQMSTQAYAWAEPVRFVPGSDTILMSTKTNALLINRSNGEIVRELHASTGPLYDLAYSPDGEKVALAGKRRSGDHPAPLLLEDKDGALLHRFGDVANTYSVAFSPDGRYLLAGTRYDAGTIAGQIHLFDLESYDLVRTYDMGAGFETADVHKVAFSNDGRWFVAADHDNIFIFDTASGAILQHIQYAAGELGGLAISPDNTQIAVGKIKIAHSADHDSVFLWDAASGQLLKSFKSDWSWDVAFSPDGAKLAAACGENDSLIKVWDIASGNELKSFDPEHGASAYAVAFSPDGNWLLTGGSYSGGQYFVKLWDYASGKLLRKFTHNYNIDDVMFTPDGENIITRQTDTALYSDRGIGRRWKLDTLPLRQPIITLAPNLAQNGNVTQFNWADYSIESAADQNLLITATLQNTAALHLYARLAEQPTLGLSDFRTLTSTVDGSYQLLIPNAQAGKYYIGVYGATVDGTQADFSIKAQFKNRHLADVTPRSAGNAGNATLQLSGLGFEETGMSAGLYQNGVEKVSGSVSCQSSSALAATFNLSGTAVGTYNLRLTWSDAHTETLQNALLVTNGAGARLQSDLIVPPFHRPERQYAAQIRYQNVGDSDMSPPLYRLSAGSNASLICADRVYTGSVQMLGIPTTGDARVIPPNAQGQISVKYTGLQSDITFQLDALFPTAAAINWDDHKDAMRPPSIDPAEWDTVFPILTGQLGATWNDYLNTLGNNAQRLRQRGDIAYCVSDQLGLEIRKARGLPTAAIAGTLQDADSGKALGSVMVTAYDDADHFYRAVSNFASGHFTLQNLPTGVYTLTAEGYYFSPTLTIQISNDTDVSDREFLAYPAPEQPDEADPVVPVANHAPALAVDAQGNAVMVWQRYGQLWTAEYSPTARLWHHSGVVSGAAGEAPALAYGDSVANGSPGFAALWRNGFGNSGQLHYSIITRDGDGDLQWSAPVTLTNIVTGAAGDTSPAIVVPNNGNPVALWLRKDWDIKDDTDLYYQQFIPPTRQRTRILLIVPADELEAFNRSPLAPLAENCLEVKLKEGKTLPSSVPLIGGKYGFEVSGSACSEIDCELKASGGLAVKVDFSDRVSGEGSTSVAAVWETAVGDPCRYAFKEGVLSLGVGATGKIPAYTFSIPAIVELEAGGLIKGDVTGSVAWKGGNFPGLPNRGEVEVTAGIGPYGKATFFKVAEAEVKGIGSVKGKYSTPPSKFSFEGWCLNLYASAGKGILSFSFSKSWGPACSGRMPLVLRAAQNGNPRQTMLSVTRSMQDGVPVVQTLLIQVEEQTGTGNIYTGANLVGAPVLSATIGDDLTDDGPPAVARSVNGEALTAWTKDSADPHSSVGSSVVVAQTNGVTFTLPVTVANADSFNRHVDIAFTGAVTPMVVWAGADASGVSLSSTYTEALNAIDASDIYYSQRVSGTWSAPAKVANISGTDEQTRLASDGNGNAVVVWTHRDGESNDDLYAALWNGSAWASAVKLGKQAGVIESLDVIYTGATTKTPLLVWAQDTDGNPETLNDLVIFHSVYSATAWTTPAMLDQAVTLQGNSEASRRALPGNRQNQMPFRSPCAASAMSGLFPNPPYPSEKCCQEKITKILIAPLSLPNALSFNVAGETSLLRTSNDPNEKLGLAGWDGAGSVISNTQMIYTIFFENVMSGTLTVPAQEVFVSDQLSDKLNWSTLRFEEVAFGDTLISLDGASGSFQTQAQANDYRYPTTTTWTVDVSGQVDAKGKIDWTFRTLDPATGLLPSDVDAGFLPVNNSTGRGEGHVTFSIEQRANLTRGTVITNMASIVFDSNEAILTNIYTNTIGQPIVYLPLVLK